MGWLVDRRMADGVVERGKAVARMNARSHKEALGTVVPVWAVEALVADGVDLLQSLSANRNHKF